MNPINKENPKQLKNRDRRSLEKILNYGFRYGVNPKYLTKIKE